MRYAIRSMAAIEAILWCIDALAESHRLLQMVNPSPVILVGAPIAVFLTIRVFSAPTPWACFGFVVLSVLSLQVDWRAMSNFFTPPFGPQSLTQFYPLIGSKIAALAVFHFASLIFWIAATWRTAQLKAE